MDLTSRRRPRAATSWALSPPPPTPPAPSPPPPPPPSGVVAAAAHPSGSLAAAAAASLDSSVRVFDVDSNASIASLDVSPPLPRSGACSSTPSGGSGGAGTGVARGFVGLLAEVFPHRGGRRHLPGDREGHRGLHRRLS
ncbi:ena/VASP-like protein [Ananas comosus]|uniref:Ena/VASP-like protein n=1 Tax=Ananas comosus TaxID=4615 RepID=A0A6P5ECZ6_ANACO|nr:ena/VASP-like protein [Ananas comosus]